MLKTIGNKIIVKVLPEEENERIGLLYIPSTANRRKTYYGKVVAIGDDVIFLKTNDIVLFDRFIGSKIIHNNEEYFILTEQVVMATIEDNK